MSQYDAEPAQFEPDPLKYPPEFIQTWRRGKEKMEAEKLDLKTIAMLINAAGVTTEYKKHLKQNYHMLKDQYHTCDQFVQGHQNAKKCLDPDFVEYCHKKKRKLFFKMRVWESAHPSLLEL